MSIFEDKQYEEMDWISKAIEPTISSINDKLHKLPDTFTITPPELMYLVTTHCYHTVDLQQMFLYMCGKIGSDVNRWADDFHMLYKCYSWSVPANSEDIVIDFETKEAYGPDITLTKTKTIFEESELLPLLGKRGMSYVRGINTKSAPIDRINEIAELLGADEASSKRSAHQKMSVVINTLSKVFAENKWNIKNIDLGDKVCTWIRLYIEVGSLPALTNFCKFKVMTHSGDPIYSIEEEPL